jgi:O-6-methylguanine DNA methyltransferase
MELYYSVFKTAAGWIAALASDKGLVKNTLPQVEKQKALFLLGIPGIDAIPNLRMFAELANRFVDYFNGMRIAFPDELDMSAASPFQKDVWQTTRSIPWGETRSYKWIAEQIGKPEAVRAAGHALGKNPLPIIIPCHRVIGSNGDLTGFSGGLGVKKQLLELEGIPTKP